MARCRRCGGENPGPARFCHACGTVLVAPQEGAGLEERKVVSVLFCDLVGFTALSDDADPEDVRAVLWPYYVAVRSELERYGGTVEKFIGDAVVAVFGAPMAHEDDAERAVRAGLSILAAIGELRTRSGLDLAVRVGIATGEALVSLSARPLEGEGIAVGDVVNTAARLQTAAGTGEIVVGEATYRLTRDAIDYIELEPVRAKGKAEPVPIWRVLGARSKLEAPALRAMAPFVGREHERSLLRAAFARVVQHRSVQLVTIIGEPGVGKSRLVAELFAMVDATSGRVTWRQGRCLPYGDGITFWALGEIVKAQAGILETDDQDGAREKLVRAVAVAVEDATERGWIVATLSPLVGLAAGGRGASREETFTGWRRFFEALAERQPLVLVVEDLHWGDAALLAFLGHLREACTQVPLLLVVTARPELDTRAPGWRGGTPNSGTLALPRLAKAETEQLLAALLGTTVLPADTKALLLQRCGGNPLYAEEFVRLLRDPGGRRNSGAAPDTGRPLQLPATLHALIAARVDALDQRDKALLHNAAVVGQVFWSGAVSTVGGGDESAVRVRLHELASREFLHPVPTSSVGGQVEYAFWHGLVRDVAYGQIPRAARAAKHQAVARWLEGTAGDRVADYAEILAHHYGQALELSMAAQIGPVEELRHALRRFTVLAGDRAVHLDPMVADAHYRRALELFPTEHPDRPAVLTRAAWAALAAGKSDTAVAVYEEACEASLMHGDRRIAGWSRLWLADLYRDRGDMAYARAQADEALALLRDGGPCVELAYTLHFFAFDAWTGGRPDEALRWAGQLLELADVIGPADLICGQDILGLALMERGRARLDLDDSEGIDDVVAAVAATRAAFEHGSAAVHGSWQLLNWQSNLAEALWLVEGTRAALSAAREAQRIAVQRGLLHPSRAVRADGLKLLFDAGQWDDLLADACFVSASGEPEGSDYWLIVADVNRAHVLLHRGHLAAAADVMGRALPQARAIGDLQVLGPALEVAASLLLAHGKRREAASRVREFADWAESAPSRRALHLPALVRVCTAVGELALAERLTEGTDLRLRRHACAHRTAGATLAEARGAFDTALGLYEEAAAKWREYGHVLEHGYARLGAGRCASRLGKPRAVIALGAARGIFASLGAQSLGIEADSCLAQTGTV